MNLRPYQSESITETCKGFKEYNKQLLVLPTGGGKTIVFANLASMARGKTLILAHREELIDQAIDKIFHATGLNAGKEKAEYSASLSDKVVVASVQSMINRLDGWPGDHFSLIVCDEAHHSISDSWQRVLNHFDSHAKVLGVTATPDRGDKRNLGSYYENVSYETNIVDMIRDGYLSPIKIKTMPIRLDLRQVHQTAGDFDSKELGDALGPYLEQIAWAIRNEAGERKTLCFLPLIATSKRFVEICQSIGIRAKHIDGYSEDRKEIQEEFARGDFDLLSNAMLLTEGYDCPSIDCVVCLRPTRSRALYSQMVGRGTRLHEGKDNLLLLDFLWMHEKHNLVRPAHLVAQDDEIAQIMTEAAEKSGGRSEMDLQDLENSAKEQREESLRRKIAENKHNESKFIDAAEWFMNMGDPEDAYWEPTMKWHRQRCTDKQRKIIEKAGIDINSVNGKGHASRIIDVYFQHQNAKPATHKQKWAMRKGGYIGDIDAATQGDARKFFAQRS
jgi:superfamily II DNA or RNA helicase